VKIFDLQVDQLREAPWNPNAMDETMMARLGESVRRYGVVENLVVRQTGQDTYEILSGNQRLRLLKKTGCSHAPCVVVDLDDTRARLLAQALNHIHGEDDLGLRAELLRDVLETVSEEEMASLLPETAASLRSIVSMGQQAIADYLENWQKARDARPKRLHFQLTPMQLEVVEEAISRMLPKTGQSRGDNPNARGTALYLLCKSYLRRDDDEH